MLGVFFYACVSHPKAKIKAIARAFEMKEYNVWLMPYECMGCPTMRNFREGERKGDATLTMKREYSKYDVIVSNTFTAPTTDMIHPDLFKEFYSH